MSRKSKRTKHTSACNDLDRSLRWIEGLPIVNKIILGFTENCRHRYTPGHVRVQMDCRGGVKAIGYSGNGIINFFIRVEPDHLETLKKEITERFAR